MKTTGTHRLLSFLSLLAVLCLAACQNDQRAAPATELYLDYQVTGEEGEDSVACRLQCRHGGPDGETVLLSPNSVRLDSLPLSADSAGFSGIYYETELPAAGFGGTHKWQVLDSAGRERVSSFQLPVFTLAELPPSMYRGDLQLELAGFPEESSRAHLLLVDTSWTSNDLNTLLTVRNGRVVVPAAQLRHLSPGPISLELSCEKRLPLESGAAPGRLLLTYTVRRSFDLAD